MVDAAQLSYLQSDAGRELLEAACEANGELAARIRKLRRRWPPEAVSAAVALVDLRRRAGVKFGCANSMFFTPEGLEQSSGERIASWRARRFPSGALILDLCCGIGGDSVHLAARGKTFAFDRNPAAVRCAFANGRALGMSGSLAAACADVTSLRLRGNAAFFDPSRRKTGRRVRSGEDYAPPLNFALEIRSRIPDLAVKVSPALDDVELASMGGRVEFVSDRGECKEAVLWFGTIGPESRRCATVLPSGVTVAADPEAPPPAVSPPREWLFEPDPAVIRAHLIPESARILGAAQIDPQIAYLTSNLRVPTGIPAALTRAIATGYRILEWLPFSLAGIQRRMTALGAFAYAVKRRGVPMEPQEIAARLKQAGDRPIVVVLTRVAGKPAAILCDPPELRDM